MEKNTRLHTVQDSLRGEAGTRSQHSAHDMWKKIPNSQNNNSHGKDGGCLRNIARIIPVKKADRLFHGEHWSRGHQGQPQFSVDKNGLVFTLWDDVIEPVSTVYTLSILQSQSGVRNCRLHSECGDNCSSPTVGCELDPLMVLGGRLDHGRTRHLTESQEEPKRAWKTSWSWPQNLPSWC